ncbi:MAG: glutamine synthetase [Erysipelotrichia bacterium]|nr:glutamine synthetase [Erysipelotrichia bacterium]NCC54116.1 glutamine synthetase [Erysipelotrichia bacterium]
MMYNEETVLSFIEQNDVKFIRLAFCDIFGTLKNISINPQEMKRAFKEGIGFDASSVKGFMNVAESDLLLFPDPDTMAILPWRPQSGRVLRFYCDIKHPDGTVFEGDIRHLLKEQVEACESLGYTPKIGSECEFYLFQRDDFNKPTKIPHDEASYFDVAPLDAGENVRREICLNLEEMNIQPESSHHEQGPGQNEVDFKYDCALQSADHVISFKICVRAVALQNGLFASFMAKPLMQESGSGMHINISLAENDRNIFASDYEDMKEEQKYFIAGILNRIKDMSLILNPTTNSYHRLGSERAPKFITWSKQNRSQLIRIPASTSAEYSRIEVRLADPACNPYLAFTLLLAAGMKGIINQEKLIPACDMNLYEYKGNDYEMLPHSLEEACHLFKQSDFIRELLPASVMNSFLEVKIQECKEYTTSIKENNSIEEFEERKYFKFI